MHNSLANVVTDICTAFGNDDGRLMDIVVEVQNRLGYICRDATDIIARQVGLPRVVVAGTVTFYSFLSTHRQGTLTIRLCDDIIDEHAGMPAVVDAFRRELGISVGEDTLDGAFSLRYTPNIGMSDQAPAALIDRTVFTELRPEQVPDLVAKLRAHPNPHELVQSYGDGNNGHRLVRSMVRNNVRRAGDVLFAGTEPGAALSKALSMQPEDIVQQLNGARLRGRGGAGFPTGMKWDFVRRTQAASRYVVCNGDEGEPGTFKDRVLLTEAPDLMFEGMTIAGYTVGAAEGILYLRGEYAYLKPFLEHVLQERRSCGLLGANIGNIDPPFNFDIRIQLGAGAYICGEETSMLASCEGRRGDPKTRPPFPTQAGYRDSPTVVNNVETFCCAARIVQNGAQWFSAMGSSDSAGTKLLSICGDCATPGVYEVPFGLRLGDALDMAGARDTQAVQVGGASGSLVGPDAFERRLCFEDLPTGGAVMVFDRTRDLLGVVDSFMRFFEFESCGYCTPCRVGNVLLRDRLREIREGRGEPADMDYLRDLGEVVKFASRCGLGQTSPNPILTTLEHFPHLYRERCRETGPSGRRRTFDIFEQLTDAERIAGRRSEYYTR
ncbi:MAG: NADH:ubiquinone oxidoreductase [Chitinivibrionales bacterium]|nr:NADH:ubiquinone oxidoreductase [Chitinivibrionales bacterium]